MDTNVSGASENPGSQHAERIRDSKRRSRHGCELASVAEDSREPIGGVRGTGRPRRTPCGGGDAGPTYPGAERVMLSTAFRHVLLSTCSSLSPFCTPAHGPAFHSRSLARLSTPRPCIHSPVDIVYNYSRLRIYDSDVLLVSHLSSFLAHYRTLHPASLRCIRQHVPSLLPVR